MAGTPLIYLMRVVLLWGLMLILCGLPLHMMGVIDEHRFERQLLYTTSIFVVCLAAAFDNKGRRWF